MNLLPDEMKTQTFACPNCAQYISSDVDQCKFCSSSITSEMKQLALQKEFFEKKTIYLGNQKNSLILGILLLTIGFGLFLNPILSLDYGSTRVPCLSPMLIPAGFVIIILSLIGYYKEKRNN